MDVGSIFAFFSSMWYYVRMTLFKNILIFTLSAILATLFVLGSFVFGTENYQDRKSIGSRQITKSLVSIVKDTPKSEIIAYNPYKSWATSTGILFLEFWRLSTAFVMAEHFPMLSFSWNNSLQFEHIQGIISLYDPFSVYNLRPVDQSYQITQITNGSFYISDEVDKTVSIYSIDAVIELTFFDKGEKMTDMILFPGMYIRFDPWANLSLKWADLFKIMLVLGDDKNSKHTGLEFVNPRVSNGSDDIFFMFKLPTATRPLFQLLHLLFNERIKQVDLVKNYTSNRGTTSSDNISAIHNPAKKNYYLLDDLRSVLSRAVQSKMDSREFRSKIENIYKESRSLVNGNSVQTTLEAFLTDSRFAIYQPTGSANFSTIYTETASILKKTPDTGKWKFFQYLSDIYSLNIVAQKKDPTFSGIDTYTPTAEWLRRTLDNNSIESKDFFDIALYAYQLLQKAQDAQSFTVEALASEATYSLINTLFIATDKYIQGLPEADQKSAYQTLVVQFYAPIANTMSRSIYSLYTTQMNSKIYLNEQYLDGDNVKFNPKIRDYLESVYATMHTSYENISSLYTIEDQQFAFISYRDSVVRIGGFMDMVSEGGYREYQQAPYFWIDIGWVILPNIISDGKIEISQSEIPQEIKPLPAFQEISQSLSGALTDNPESLSGTLTDNPEVPIQ